MNHPLPTLRSVASAVLLMAGAALASPAAADERLVSGAGGLNLVSTLDETIKVTMDPTLAGKIRISGDKGLDCVSVSGQGPVSITTDRCESDFSGLEIAVPPGPVNLTIQSSGDVELADMIGGPVNATIDGSGDLKAGRVTALNVTVHGSGNASFTEADGPVTVTVQASGDVRIARLTGILNARQQGSGDIAIGSIEAGTVQVEGTSSGDLLIGGGNIGALNAKRHGSGDMVVAASIGYADVTASGGGDVKLGEVKGAIRKSASGGSDIVVGGSGLVTEIENQVAKVASQHGSSSDITVLHHNESFRLIKHFITIGIVIFVLIMLFRVVKRAGGINGVRNRFGATPAPAAPLNQGVLNLADIMQKLDQRMGRVETYVTSREFDLHQKFRDLK